MKMYVSPIGAWSAVGCLLLCLINRGAAESSRYRGVGDPARLPLRRTLRDQSIVPPYRDVIDRPDHQRDSARLPIPPVHDAYVVYPNVDDHAWRDATKSVPGSANGEGESAYYEEYAVSAENQGLSGRKSPDNVARRADWRYEEASRNELKDEEMMRKMSALDKILFEDENDIVLRNTIEDGAGAETSIPEETKRVVRQVRRQRPGFFWTLARLAFETFNDTRSAIQQINDIITDNFEPDVTSAKPPVKSDSLMTVNVTTTTLPSTDQSGTPSNMMGVNVTTTATTRRTTTARPPFKFTRTGVAELIRRNLRGLMRLFNIEWQDALNQSDITVREFQKDLGNQVGSFLQDNPNAS